MSDENYRQDISQYLEKLTSLFIAHGAKKVSKTDIDKRAYVLTREQKNVMDVAGRLPTSDQVFYILDAFSSHKLKGGLTHEQVNVNKALSASGSAEVKVEDSTWIALRVRGSYHGKHGEIAAHTSCVQVLVEGKPIYSQADATTILEQIEGAIAYLDTIAPRPEATRLKQMRATLEAAHNRLHQQMHKSGVYHDHTVLHDHGHAHEH